MNFTTRDFNGFIQRFLLRVGMHWKCITTAYFWMTWVREIRQWLDARGHGRAATVMLSLLSRRMRQWFDVRSVILWLVLPATNCSKAEHRTHRPQTTRKHTYVLSYAVLIGRQRVQLQSRTALQRHAQGHSIVRSNQGVCYWRWFCNEGVFRVWVIANHPSGIGAISRWHVMF